MPGPKGMEGQVIKRDDIDFRHVSDSFGGFLTQIATDLERKKQNVFRQR